jgi:glycosyltransferase involved in cell wall biosynthesis
VLELLPRLAKKISNIAYLVVGDGPDRKRLEEKAERLCVADYVVFSGYIPEGEKADHFRLADVFIMPSRGEGFGFVFLEALASGVPVIGSKLDGSCEALCGGEMGILVDPRNYKDIENGILTALEQPRGVIPEKLENFSFNNFSIRLNNIIQEINRT